MTPADRVIADAVAAVIADAVAVADHITAPHDDIDRASHAAVHELRRLGWHITAHPMTTTHPEPTP